MNWNIIVELALSAASLLAKAIDAIMSYSGKSAEEKAQVLAMIRQRAKLDNAMVQAVEVREVPDAPKSE